MARCVLHLGAHRTGTTLLQRFMRDNKEAARRQGLRFIETSECRKGGFLGGVIYRQPAPDQQERVFRSLEASLAEGFKLVLSDENILGTMQKNLRTGVLYPDVPQSIARLGAAVELFDTVCLSVRPPVEWWASALAYLLQQDAISPDANTGLAPCNLFTPRWSEITSEICDLFPRAQIVVRDFPVYLSDPRRQFQAWTGWAEVEALENVTARRVNASKRGRKLLAQSGIARRVPFLFEGKTRQHSRRRHREDLKKIRSILKGRGRLISH